MSTLSVGTIQSNSATAPPTINNSAGTAIGTFCRAWVNFNGTGAIATRATFNVTSIGDNGAGDYTVNFTTALPDANYAVSGCCRQMDVNAAFGGASICWLFGGTGELTTLACRFRVGFKGNTVGSDSDLVTVAFFR